MPFFARKKYTKSYVNLSCMNNNDLSMIFKELHGALDLKSLVPLKKLELVPKEQWEELVDYLGVDESDLYQNPSAVLNPFCYVKDAVYTDLYSLNAKHLKLMYDKAQWVTMENEKPKSFIQVMNERMGGLISRNEWEGVFSLMDKKLLIPRFIEYFDRVPVSQRYEIFVQLYVRSEYGFEKFSDEFLKKVFAERFLSTEWEERMSILKRKVKKQYTEDDHTFIVYHGHNSEHNPKDEYSWTLKKNVAKFFANRFGTEGTISEKRISLKDVVDFFVSRGEDEIILNKFETEV